MFQTSLPVSFFFLTGSWVWSDGFPLERLSWVYFCPLSFLPSFCLAFFILLLSDPFSVRSLCLFVWDVCLSFFVFCRRCAVYFLFVCCRVLLPLAVAHVVVMHVGGGYLLRLGGPYVCCGVCVFSSASPCFKESRLGEVAPLCMTQHVACFFFSLSRPLASCPYGCFSKLCCACCF